MRLLADENFPLPVIRELRLRGHDVLSVREQMKGSPDRAVLEQANLEDRIVITLDKDFGELAFALLHRASCGVILFRLAGRSPQVDNARMLAVFENRTDFAGRFTVVGDERIRVRPLPSAPNAG